jgi:hypothetical protein
MESTLHVAKKVCIAEYVFVGLRAHFKVSVSS